MMRRHLFAALLLCSAPAWAQTKIQGSRVLEGTLNYCEDAGTTDAYACNLSPAVTAYVTGAAYCFKSNTANTGAATLNLNSLGAKTIKKVGGGITTDLADNDIRVGQRVCAIYDGTNLQMTSQLGNAAAGGSVPPREFYWTASALLPLEHAADSIPPVAKVEGTNVDLLVRDFDDTTDECVTGTFLVPEDLDTTGTVAFRVKWYPATAAANNVVWDVRHVDRDHGESWDAALTTVAAAASAASASANVITDTTWTATVATLGWDALDTVLLELCRDANHASDNLVGDARLIDFAVSAPRS